MSVIGDMFGGGGDAADAAIRGAELAAGSQEEALDYLKEREAIPQQFREGALTKMAGIQGLEGGQGNEQQFIDSLVQSPLYQAIIGGRESGEDAIMRNAGATGGLRSGNTQEALYDHNTQLENQALLQTYNQNIQGLQGLAGLPSMAPQIANTISDIGMTRGQGQIAAGQAEAAGQANSMNNLLGVGQLATNMYSSGMFSDRRLKKNIEKIGEVSGFNWYKFTWNKVAEAMGLSGFTYGCMADEVFEKRPDAVTLKQGFMFINYSELGVL